MDRGKGSANLRGSKGKITQHPSDLYALGTKPSSSSRDAEAKRSAMAHPKLSSSHSTLTSSNQERKREATSTALTNVPPNKKTKVVASSVAARSVAGSSTERFGSGVVNTPLTEPWENIAQECDEKSLALNVINALADGDNESAVAFLLGGLKTLKIQRYKPEPIVVQSLLFISKANPSILRKEIVMQALCSLLRRDSVPSFKSKGNPFLPVMAVNLLMKAYQDITNWPEMFVKCYVEDALADRIWVDHDLCTSFSDNIIASFNTKTPPKSLLQPELSALGGRDTSSPLTVNEDDSTEGGYGKKKNLLEKCNIPVCSRFPQATESVEQLVLEAVKEQLSRRQAPETVTRNFLRFLSTSCGLVEIRGIAVSRLEIWLQNAKLMRSAQELLTYLCYNCIATTQRDIEVTSQLVKMRLKTKALINVYLSCLREMITIHPENLPLILKHTIYNELSNARNPNNMPVLAVIFQTAPEPAANGLAEIFLELLLHKDDYLRPLRALLREIVRVLRYDIDMHMICHALIRERKDTVVALREFEFRERMFLSVVDLICLCMFLAVSPQVREAASLHSRGDKKEIPTLQKFQNQVSKIQRDSVWWLYEVVSRVYRPNPQDFVASLRKILLLEPVEIYCKPDMWPPENDRNIILRLTTEVPLSQSTLIRVLLIGLSKDHPLQQVETLDFCEPLVKRASVLSSEIMPMLQIDKVEIIDLIFNLCTYHHPENISLPPGYNPPQLAISNQYWKGWIILLILAAHNPTTFGNLAWEKYPTLRIFMEMCITNHFIYPPPTMAMCDNFEELKTKELQIAALEKQQILEFESHLAAASTKITITEHNSLLLPQLITMAPMGVSRRPPPGVLEQLTTLNSMHRLGHLLCRSRRPDFLLDIIQRQGPSQHMPWLADLVQNSEGTFSHLPVQCLCEFLLSSVLTESNVKHKQAQLIAHLHALLTSTAAPACEVLEYFLRRLGSPHAASRNQAIKGIKLVLQPTDDEVMEIDPAEGLSENDSWLLRQLPILPHFTSVRPQVILALRQACQVENDPIHVSSYIQFLAKYTINDNLSDMLDLVLDMAQLIVERSTIIAAILPVPEETNQTALMTLHSLMSIFCKYLEKAREPQKGTYQWSDCHDQIIVQWVNGEECTMHILVLHAMIILLTYGPSEDPDLFHNLLETWFPLNDEQPKAYLVDTSEQALLIPDWLKLRMIRSHVRRLVDAALVDLEPPQLVLFIQSFGIPVDSMSQLLHALDTAVTSDHCSVGDAVLDKSYMAQLVEVQHRRGATGGQTFVQVLQLQQTQLPDDKDIEITSWKQKLPEKILKKNICVHFDPNQVFPLLNTIFLNKPYAGDKDQDFKMLIKDFTLELKNLKPSIAQNRICQMIINYVIANHKSHNFIQSLLTLTPETSLLLRLLLENSKLVISLLGDPVMKMYKEINEQKVPVVIVLKKFIKICEMKNESSSVVKKKELDDFVTVLCSADNASFEYIGKKILEKDQANHQNTSLIEGMVNILLESKVSENVDGLNFKRIGLLVDWLASVEPELIGNCPDLQMDLLFSKVNKKVDTKESKTFRPYLLTLLIHRASWATLHQCIGHLLNDSTGKYDPTAVLDFMWALTRNPKLWQGRDKITPKHHKPEDVLELSNAELKSLVSFMLQEAQLVSNSSKSSRSIVNCIESRLPLLLQCLDENHVAIACVARFLISTIKNDNNSTSKEPYGENISNSSIKASGSDEKTAYTQSQIAEQFMLLLYMHVPRILHYVLSGMKQRIFDRTHVSELSTSVLDKLSHCLFTALAANPQSKDWQRKLQDYELIARKMAAAHPVLVLRQLPMIGANLHGRTHLEFCVFKSRGHLNLFTHALGILELLQVQIFNEEYQWGLEKMLDAFFSLFRYHGHIKELIPILSRFITVVQAYVSHNAKRALKYIQPHAHLLNDLHIMHPNIISLRDLMTGILLPRDTDSNTDQINQETLLAVVPVISSEPLPQHWEQLTSSLSRLQGDDVQSSLQEIDHLSNRKPAILDSILDSLYKLISSPAAPVRNIAHTLLAKYLKYNPASEIVSSSALTAVLRCLDSSNPDIVISTLDRLPDLVVCMQENAIPILQKVFSLGIGSDVNTAIHINNTIAVLNLQIGC